MWIVLALSASVMWGLVYVLGEQVYKRISVLSAIGIVTLITAIVLLMVAHATGSLERDLHRILSSGYLARLVMFETGAFILAELLIAYSITGKNATLAGLIEITYPIFIAVFAYWLFREGQLNPGIALGGILIFTGVALVYYFAR